MNRAKRWATRLDVVGKLFLGTAIAVLMIGQVTTSPDEARHAANFQTITYWFGLFISGFCICAIAAPMLRTWAKDDASQR